MKRLFLLLALVGMIATSCEDSGIEEPSNPIEQPDDNTDEEQSGDDENKDEEQPGGDENEDDDESPVFEIDGPGKYTIGAEGGSIEVVVTTNLEYRLEVSEDAQSWLTIADTRAVRTERLTISVSPNNTDSERTATISVFDGADNKVFSFTLTQEYANDDNTGEEQPGDDENEDDGELPVFEIDGPGEYTIGAEGGSIDVVVTTNLEYRLEVSEDAQSWLTIADTRAVRTERLTISVSPNNTDSERTATISVFDGADNKVFSFTLTQEYANPDEIIKFVDNTTKTICIVNWDTNGDAELSIGEAVAVTDIGTIFQSKDIMSFDEFKYFTSVTTIGPWAFMDCANLVKISIPDSVTMIGDWAFNGCNSLTEFNGKFASEDGRCLIVDGVLTFFAPYGLTEYTIPDSVTAIGYGAFYGCDSLTSVTIPDGVTTISSSAFYGCDSLTSVTIGDGVTEIGGSAFSGCTSLTSVTIGDGVTEIGDYAFSGCSSLTSVTIGDGVTEIGNSAFYGCSSLISVTIPDSVTTIGWNAFYQCSSLTSVTIPDSVTTIGGGAFQNCSSLTSVYCKATTPPSLDSGVFGNNGSGRKIYVPAESVQAYKSADGWRDYADAIVGYDFNNGVVVE